MLTCAIFKCITNTRFETTHVPLILADSGIEWALILSSCTSTNCNCVLNDIRFNRMSKKNPGKYCSSRLENPRMCWNVSQNN